MRNVVICLAALAIFAASAHGQTTGPINGTASFQSIDACGGQSAFVGPNSIIEESSANCMVSGSISWMSSVYTVTATLPGAQVGDQISFVGGSPSPSCLGNSSHPTSHSRR